MSDATHAYHAPDTANAELPAQVATYLDGTDLLAKPQALRLSTVDVDGWPHAALLSAGDMLALPSGHIRFVTFPQPTMTANLERTGRVTITLSLDGGMCELRMTCQRLAFAAPDVPLALFEAKPEQVRMHKAPYADISSGIEFRLHDPEAVLPRWQRQIAAIREAG